MTGSETFGVVLCDPPWAYNSRAMNADTRFGGGATGHYNVSEVSPMEEWSHQFLAMRPESGVMLMWVTGPHIETAPKLMRSWGYEPIKPIWYWVKTYPGSHEIFYGPGAYTGSNVEFVLLGQASMRNIMTPANAGGRKGVSEVVYSPHPRDDANKIIHSRKPSIFRDLAVTLFGDHHRVEVFARERHPEWWAIGDQIDGGEPIQPGRIIRALPPVTAFESATRRTGKTVQSPLFAMGEQ